MIQKRNTHFKGRGIGMFWEELREQENMIKIYCMEQKHFSIKKNKRNTQGPLWINQHHLLEFCQAKLKCI